MVDKDREFLKGLLHELRSMPNETEWIEFKHNNDNPEEIGEYLSALANSAALAGKVNAYLVWGIDNGNHDIVGTSFKPKNKKVGNEELESWLLRLLKPKIDFQFYEFIAEENPVVILEVSAAYRHPLQFKGIEYIRIGTYKKKLKDFPEKERCLWKTFENIPFEHKIALENVFSDEIFTLLDYPAYFDLLNLPLPDNRSGILSSLNADEMIRKGKAGNWDITNLGAILFAKKLSSFPSLKRKALRVIQYKNDNRMETIREQEGSKGYACGFAGLIDYILNLLPSNEVIEKALRQDIPMFPELAVRELVANAIIHQDFHISGTSAMVEIFSNRIEITNPGLPLVKTERFLDSPPRSRNERIASFMRRIGICEERGSGIDKVVFQTEIFQLPAPIFETKTEHTQAILCAHKDFKEMDKEERVRACYLHACLKYVQRDYMTNTSLRNRFGIEQKNSAMVSRIIKDTINAGLIRCYDDTVGSKAMKYLPDWS